MWMLKQNSHCHTGASNEHRPQNQNHRAAGHRAPHRPGRHALRRAGPAGGGRLQRRRPGPDHVADHGHPREAGRRDPPVPRADRQAIRRQRHLFARRGAAQLPCPDPGHRRRWRAHRRDGRQQPGQVDAAVQGSRHQGDTQVHLGAPRAEGRVDRCRRAQHRRLRVRWASRRRRRAQHDPAAAGGRCAQGALHRVRRHGRRPLAGGGPCRWGPRASTWARASWPPWRPRFTTT